MTFQIYKKALPEYKQYFHHKNADGVLGEIKKQKDSGSIMIGLSEKIVTKGYNKEHPRLEALVQKIRQELAKPHESKPQVKVAKPQGKVAKPHVKPSQEKPKSNVPIIQVFASRLTNGEKAKKKDFETLIHQLACQDPLVVVRRRQLAADSAPQPVTKLEKQLAADSYILPMTELEMLKNHARAILKPAEFIKFEKNLKIACREAVRLREIKAKMAKVMVPPRQLPKQSLKPQSIPKTTALEKRMNDLRNLARLVPPREGAPLAHPPRNGSEAPSLMTGSKKKGSPNLTGRIDPARFENMSLDEQLKQMALSNPNMAYLFQK
jgi:hypothetical protein